MSLPSGHTYDGAKHLTPESLHHIDSTDGGRGPVDENGNSKLTSIGELNPNHRSYKKPTTMDTWFGQEEHKKTESWVGSSSGNVSSGGALGAGLGGGLIGVLMMLPFAMVAMVIGWWIYPITGLATILLWHVLTYAMSQVALFTFSHPSWCENPSFFSLTSALWHLKTCGQVDTHALFGYNKYAALLAGLLASVTFFFLVSPIERRLTRSGTYVAVRHVWRCAIPMLLLLTLILGISHGLTVIGRVGITAATAFLIHWIVSSSSRSVALTSRQGPRLPYFAGGAFVVLVPTLYMVWIALWAPWPFTKEKAHYDIYETSREHIRDAIIHRRGN
jgi:hypothetical protein